MYLPQSEANMVYSSAGLLSIKLRDATAQRHAVAVTYIMKDKTDRNPW